MLKWHSKKKLLFIIISIISINTIFSKMETNKQDNLVSISTVQANSAANTGDAVANSNSVSGATLNKDTSLATDQSIQSGDVVASLSNSGASALTNCGNANASSTSTSQAVKAGTEAASPSDQPNTNDLIVAQANSQSTAATQQGNALSVAVANSSSADNTVIAPTTVAANPSCPDAYNWTNLEINALAMSVSSAGVLYYISLDGYLYKLTFVGGRPSKIRGDYTLRNLVKIAVGSNNNIFLVNAYNDGYYLSSENNLIKLPGCIKDITVSRSGDVYKLGCDSGHNGYNVYRLICKKDSSCNRPDIYSQDDCTWFKLDFQAIKIALSSNGVVYLIDNQNDVYEYDGFNMAHFLTLKARDLAVSNDGTVFVAGMDKNIYRSVYDETGNYVCVNSNARAITIGPLNMPFVISDNSSVWFTSKYSFN